MQSGKFSVVCRAVQSGITFAVINIVWEMNVQVSLLVQTWMLEHFCVGLGWDKLF